MAVLLWLELTRLKNGLIQLTQSPLRLLGFAVIAFTLVVGLFGQLISVFLSATHRSSKAGLDLPPEILGPILYALLLMVASQSLLLGATGKLFSFSPSDVNFLFPAPVSRRTVLLFHLTFDYIKVLGLILWLVLITLTVIAGTGGQYLRQYIILAPLALTLLIVLVTNAGRWIHLLSLRRRPPYRFLPPIVAWSSSLILLAAVGWMVGRSGQVGWSVAWNEFIGSSVARTVLYPITSTWEVCLVAFTGRGEEAVVNIALLFLLTVISLIVLLSQRENFYEPAITVSQWRYRIREALRRGDYEGLWAVQVAIGARKRPRLSFPPFGSGPWALLWKEVLVSLRANGSWVLFLLFLSLLWFVVAIWISHRPFPTSPTRRLLVLAVFGFPHLALAYLSIIAPSLAAGSVSGLHGESGRLDIVKALPFRPWVRPLTRALLPTIGYTVLATLLYILSHISRFLCPSELLMRKGLRFLFAVETDWTLYVILMGPGFALTLNSLACLMSLLFPKMTDPAQRFISFFFFVLLLPLVITPPILAAVLLFLASSLVIGVAGATLLNFLISALLLRWSGTVFCRLEPSES